MNFELPPLPFAPNALEPHISERTVLIHFEKHHKGYLKKLDAALEGKPEEREKTLEQLISTSSGKVFNCAAQVWNHSFYWMSLDPTGKSNPDANLGGQIEKDFGSIAAMQQELKSVAAGEFGSGWGWLSWNEKSKSLVISSTTDAENPIPEDLVPLLTLDVWEHAYYLDYQNERGKYLASLVDNILNWDFANANFAAARG